MPRGHRRKRTAAVEWALPLVGLLIALGIAFGLGVLKGSEKSNQAAKQQQQQYAAAKIRYSEAIAGKLVDSRANYTAYPEQDAGACYYAEDHDTADLCAQWRAAIAAERAARWTQAGFWVSVWAGILSALGLGFLMQSLRQTEKSLKLARKENKRAQRVTEAELRPYLFIDHVKLIEHKSLPWKEEEPESFQGRAEIRLQNFGKVPARNINVFDRNFLASMHSGKFWQYTKAKVELPVCAPNHSRRVFANIFIIPENRADWDEGIIDLILRVSFTYQDDSGKKYAEKADYRLSGDDLNTFYLLRDWDIAAARRGWAQYQLELNEMDADDPDEDSHHHM